MNEALTKKLVELSNIIKAIEDDLDASDNNPYKMHKAITDLNKAHLEKKELEKSLANLKLLHHG